MSLLASCHIHIQYGLAILLAYRTCSNCFYLPSRRFQEGERQYPVSKTQGPTVVVVTVFSDTQWLSDYHKKVCLLFFFSSLYWLWRITLHGTTPLLYIHFSPYFNILLKIRQGFLWTILYGTLIRKLLNQKSTSSCKRQNAYPFGSAKPLHTVHTNLFWYSCSMMIESGTGCLYLRL